MAELPPNPKQAYGDKKPNVALVPPALDLYAAVGFADGVVKYGPYNWRGKSVEAMTYVAAIIRHLGAWVDREDYSEPETFEKDGLTYNLGVKPQLAHVAACVAILIDAMESGNLIDNRPPLGPALKIQQDWHGKLPAGKPVLVDERASLWVPPVARSEPRPLNPRFDHACPDLDQEYPLCSCPRSHCLAETIGSEEVYEFSRGYCQPQRMQCARQRFDVV